MLRNIHYSLYVQSTYTSPTKLQRRCVTWFKLTYYKDNTLLWFHIPILITTWFSVLRHSRESFFFWVWGCHGTDYDVYLSSALWCPVMLWNLIRYVGKLLPDYTASHARRWYILSCLLGLSIVILPIYTTLETRYLAYVIKAKISI